MNHQKFSQQIVTIGIIFLFLSGCGAPATPLPTSVPPSATPIPTSIPPTATPIPRPTFLPGTKFEVMTEGLKLQLVAPWCNMTKIGRGKFTTEGVIDDVKSMMDFSNNLFGPGDPTIFPKQGDDVLCYIKGEVLEGAATDAQLKTWVDEDTVYLIDQANSKSDLVFAGVMKAEQVILMLFSAPREYSPAQLQMPDVLVDLP